MTKTTVEAGAQVGSGPNFWSRLSAGVDTIVQLIAWGPDGSETIVDDVSGFCLPVQSYLPETATFTNLGGQLSGGTATLPAAPTSKGRWVQNLDAAPLKLTFDGGAFLWLAPATDRDNPGGAGSIWNDNGLTYLGQIVLNSALADHHFGGGQG